MTTEDRVLIIEQFVITHEKTSDAFRKEIRILIIDMNKKMDGLVTSHNKYKLNLTKEQQTCQKDILVECKKYSNTVVGWVLGIPLGISSILGVIWMIVKLS